MTARRWLPSLLALATFACAMSAAAQNTSAHIERMGPAPLGQLVLPAVATMPLYQR